MAQYELAYVGVDPVILTIRSGKLYVYLCCREKEPFKGMEELPGGLLRGNETAEETLRRKLNEVVGEVYFEQFYTFTAPKRDPRERAVSVGFVALVSCDKVRLQEGWIEVEGLGELAFDHREIIDKALKFLQRGISVTMARAFLPSLFALNSLQEVYEVVEGKSYDNRNFRKKMINSGLVEETDEREKGVSHRPAKLWKFVETS